MLPLDEIRLRLGRACIARAARESGLHYNIVYRIAKGMVKNPTYESVKALSDHFTQGAWERKA